MPQFRGYIYELLNLSGTVSWLIMTQDKGENPAKSVIFSRDKLMK